MTIESIISIGIALGSGIVSTAIAYGSIKANISIMRKEIERIDKQLEMYSRITADLAEIKGQVNILVSKFLNNEH